MTRRTPDAACAAVVVERFMLCLSVLSALAPRREQKPAATAKTTAHRATDGGDNCDAHGPTYPGRRLRRLSKYD